MYKVERLVNGVWYFWGQYETQEKAESAGEYLANEYGMTVKVSKIF